MSAYKTPDFNERTAAAREARQRALDKLRDKPAPDSSVIAARQAAQAAREAAAAERRAVRQAAAEDARIAKAAKAAAVDETVPDRPPPTEAELKAARDARYAARKARKK